MKKLLVYLKAYRKESILAPAFKMLEAILELFVPLVVAQIIDVGINGADRAYICKMVLVLVMLGAIGLAFSITAQFFAAKAAVGFTTKLRHVLFRHIQTLSYAELDAQGTSTLITRMTSDMNQVQSGVNLTLRLLLRSPFVVIGAMVMAFTIDVRSALVFAVEIPVLAVIVFGIMFACIPLYKKVQTRLDDVLGQTRDNLSGVRVLRAFCKEEEQVEEFHGNTQYLATAQKFVGKISALLNPITYVVVNVAIIALVYTGAIRVELGILTQGAVVALYNYMAQILVELIKLANLIINLMRSMACGNRIQAVLEVQPSMQDGTQTVNDVQKQHDTQSANGAQISNDTQTADGALIEADAKDKDNEILVEFDHVHFRYPGAAQDSLEEISFQVKKGQTVGIIGGTGSGKTSLINMIPRFYDCQEGTVRIHGTDVREYRMETLREQIGVVPQKAVLFAGSIRDNMKWGNSEATDEQIREALVVAQATVVVDSKKDGLSEMVEQGGRNFSGGQRQRLTIARALLKQPEILILDDSSSALDYATDAALRRALKQLDPKPTLFIVSQRTVAIQQADLILVMDDGKLVGRGTHDELLESCPVYREIYESQFKQSEEVSA